MFCPICDSTDFIVLGTLGNISYLRCRNCGIDFQTDSKAIFDGEYENED